MSLPQYTWHLRDLPFVARLVIAVFLCSVGLGFFAALVQVKIQDASPGEPIPGQQNLIDKFHGQEGVSTLERLITADENLPFTASGTMHPAFTTKSGGWTEAVETVARLQAEKEKLDFDELAKPDQSKRLAQAKSDLRNERTGEMLVMAHWIHHGLPKEAYDDNFYPLPEELRKQPISERFLTNDEKGVPGVRIHDLVDKRCVKCHTPANSTAAGDAPLNEYWRIKSYAADKGNGVGAMSMRKLAQTTHAHLLGFAMLYFLTGVLFALTNLPATIRFLIAPTALLAQVVDISFWWLARLDNPYGSIFAQAITFTGGIAGVCLALQIVLTLFSLFGKFGKFVLFLLLLAVMASGWFVYDLKVKGYLEDETSAAKVVTN